MKKLPSSLFFLIALAAIPILLIQCREVDHNHAVKYNSKLTKLLGSDTCCYEAKMKYDYLLLQWIKTLAPKKRAAQLAILDTGVNFYPGHWTTYVRADSVQACINYDKFIERTNLLKDPWAKITAVLTFVYENAREGDYNSSKANNSLYNQLLTGRDMFVAFTLDKMSGTWRVVTIYCKHTAGFGN